MKREIIEIIKEAGKHVSEKARQTVESDPRLTKIMTDMKLRYETLRQELEGRCEHIEDDLWRWINEKQKEIQRHQTHAARLKQAHRFYSLLGVQPNASRQEIKDAWRAKMKTIHPDRFAHDPSAQKQAAEQARLVNQAYQELIELLKMTRAQ